MPDVIYHAPWFDGAPGGSQWAIAKRLRHRILAPLFVGSNPTSPVRSS